MAAELTGVQEHGLISRSWRSTRSVLGQAWATRSGRIGLTILVFFTLMALFAPWLAPEDPTREFSQDILAPPSSEHSTFAIPPDLDELLLACLAKDPKDRPADAGTLRRRLEQIPFAERWDQDRAALWWRSLPPRHFA